MNRFTSEELYVLASLMGREFIIGVEGKTLEDNMSDLKGMLMKNYSDLEARGLLEYRIDGTLLVDPEIRKIVKILNKADSVFVVSTDMHGAREKVNYLRYGNEYCKLIDKGTSYSAAVVDEFDSNSLLVLYGIQLSGEPLKKYSVPISFLTELSDMYNSFNGSEADAMLTEIINEPETEKMMHECLSHKNNSFVMKEYKRSGKHMVNVGNYILRYINDFVLSFSICDGDTVIMSIYRKELN